MADLTLADLTSQANGAFALSEDQKRRIAWQQLMALGFGIAGSRDWTGIGRAGLNAMQMGASEEERLQRDKMQAMQVQAAALQNANALRQYNQQGQLNDAWQRSQIPGQPAQPGMPEMGPPDAQGGMQMAVPPKPAQLPGVDFQRVLAEGGPLAAQYAQQAEAQRLKSVRAGAPLMSSPGMPPPGLPAPAGAMPAPGGMQGGPVAPPSTVAPAVPPIGQMQPPTKGAMLMSAINYKFKLADYLARNDDMQGAQAAESSAIELVKSIPGVKEARYEIKPGETQAQLAVLRDDGGPLEWTGVYAHPEIAKTHGDVMAEKNLKVSQGQLGVAQQNAAETVKQHTWERGKGQIITGPNGEVFSVNPTTNVGGPVMDSTGKPLSKGEKPLTESQGNATAFGMRSATANSIFNQIEDSGAPVGGLQSLAAKHGVGNYVAPEWAQQAQQAKMNFMTANLRKESGASISPSEFETQDKTYFPQPGDHPAVIKQKRQARDLAIQALSVQAGQGRSNIEQARKTTSGWKVERE